MDCSKSGMGLDLSIILKSISCLGHELGKRYVWNKGKRYKIIAKLDPVKIRYIIQQKELGRSTKEIVAEMKVSGRWVQKLYARYRKTGEIPSLKNSGRPKAVITDRMGKMVSICVEPYQIAYTQIVSNFTPACACNKASLGVNFQ